MEEYAEYLIDYQKIGFVLDTNQYIAAKPSHVAIPFVLQDRITASGFIISRKSFKAQQAERYYSA